MESSGALTQEEIKKKQKDFELRKFNQYLNVIKFSGDSITSTSMLGWDQQFLGVQFNDGLIGLGGLTSALIACYNTYPAAPPKK